MARHHGDAPLQFRDNGLDHARMHGHGHVQPAGCVALRAQRLFRRPDRGGRAGQHAERIAVHGGQVAAEGQQRRDLRLGQRHRRHRAFGQAGHEPAAPDHDAHRILGREDAGQAGRDIFAQAVAQHQRGPHAARHPPLRDRVFHREQRGLQHLDACKLPGGPGFPAGCGMDQRPQVHPGLLPQDTRARIQRLPEHRAAPVESLRHADVLRAGAGEQEHHLGRGGRHAPGRGQRSLQPLRRQAGFVRRHGHPPGPGPAAALQRVRDVRQRLLRHAAQVGGHLRAGCVQRGLGARGQRKHLPLGLRNALRDFRALPCQPLHGTARVRHRRRCLFQHHVHIGAADAERTHARAAREGAPGPRGGFGVDVEGAGREIDARVRLPAVQARWQLRVLQGHGGLDEPRHAGRRVQVADVGLHGADRAEAAPVRVRAECLRERCHLDGIAQRRARAVRLHVADGVGRDARDELRRADHLGLPVHAGRGEADLGRAVVVGRAALDHGMHRVAVAQRVLQPLERDHAHAAADHRARGIGVERAAVPVGRQDRTGLVAVAALLQQVQPHAARQRHVAFVAQQRLAGHVHGHQRCGAGRLHAHRRAAQVQLVGHAGAERAGRIGAHQAEHVGDARARVQPRRGQQVAHEVHARPFAAVHAHLAFPARRIAACVLQAGPGAFQEQPLLRIELLGLARREAEELRVEAVEPVERHARLHIVRIAAQRLGHAQGLEFRVRIGPDGVQAIADALPEGLDIRRAGKPPRHADDRDFQAARCLRRDHGRVHGCIHSRAP